MVNEENMKILSERMDSIEKLLRMLLANDLLSSFDDCMRNKHTDGKYELSFPIEIEGILDKNMMTIAKVETIDGYHIVYMEMSKDIKLKVKEYKRLDYEIKSFNEKVIPIFCFDSLNGMQRKRFIEENISFCIREKEIHVSSKK